jgi:hypothetical protein
VSRARRPATEDTPRVIHLLPVVADSRTVATAGPPGTFTYRDVDWQKIKICLARLDIDADTVTVGDRWWAQPDPIAALAAPPQRPLKEQLQELASDYRQLWRGLTPKQEAMTPTSRYSCGSTHFSQSDLHRRNNPRWREFIPPSNSHWRLK